MTKTIAEVRPTWYLVTTTAPFDYIGPFYGPKDAAGFREVFELDPGEFAVVRTSKTHPEAIPPTTAALRVIAFWIRVGEYPL